MTKFKYTIIKKDNKEFAKICKYCDKSILEREGEDKGPVYESDIVILSMNNTLPIGFSSIVDLDDTYFIQQLAVKKEYRGNGVGIDLISKSIELASKAEKGLSMSTYGPNCPLNNMLESQGFELESTNGEYLYTHKQNQVRM